VPVTETYQETEYKTEYRTEIYSGIEDVIVSTSGETSLTPVSQWHAPIYFVTHGNQGSDTPTYFYGYEIDMGKHIGCKVDIKLAPKVDGDIGVYDLTGVNIAVLTGDPNLTIWEWLSVYAPGWNINPALVGNLNTILSSPGRTLSFGSVGVGLDDKISFDAYGIREFAIIANTWNSNAISSVKLVWTDNITEKRTVTKEEQVPYQTLVQVEKQRTVMQTKQVPFWEAILSK
jgi:hypothetical protein